MACRFLLVVLVGLGAWASPAQQPPADKAPPDPLDGPPVVSAKAWAVVNAKTGKVMKGFNHETPRPMASTSKIMTAWIVLQLAADNPKVLDEVVAYSEKAAKTTGSSAKLAAGEMLPAGDLLYGLMLPSGNDAAVALAEHFGDRFGTGGEPFTRFVAEMNARAKKLGLTDLHYRDPHGLSSENVGSARDLAALAVEALKDERFRTIVTTRRRACEVTDAKGGKRTAEWANTNRLLDIEGYEGVKTGTTTPAGNCLVAAGRRGGDRLVVVVLGATAADGRYVDARNLFRWGWHEVGKK